MASQREKPPGDHKRWHGVKPRSQTYLKYVYACFKLQETEKAYQMLLMMEKEWRFPDAREYNRMLRFFKFHGHAEGAKTCLNGLMQDIQHRRSAGAPMNSVSPDLVQNLFREAQDNRQPADIVELAGALKKANISLDRFQQVGLALAHMQLNEPVEAFATIVELYDKGRTLPEFAFDQVSKEMSNNPSAVDESYYLLESRKAESLSVPLPAVNLIMEACAQMGDLDRAFATWAELDKLDVTPDIGTFNALLHTCVKTRELASGRRLLARMAQDGIEANQMTYLHQTALHIVGREEANALSMVKACKDAEITPHARMYTSLIIMCARSGKRDRAKELLDMMEADGHNVTKGLRNRAMGGDDRY